MKKLLLIIPAVLFYLSGCTEVRQYEPQYIKDEGQLNELVIQAVNGDEKANDSLSTLTDPQFQVQQEYNKIVAREIRTLDGKKYYYVLLEHPNPVYNRIAIYDSTLNLYLLNKDINGSISIENLNVGGFEFLLVKESFLSKDILIISRIHLIKLDTSEVYQVLEMYSGIKTQKLEYRQVIEELNAERIVTKITTVKTRPEPDKGDVFVYNPAEKKFLSDNNTFKQLVIETVNNFSGTVQLPQILDSLSAVLSAGIILTTADTLAPGAAGTEGFSLTFKEDWKKISDLVISDYLNQNMKGTKFINTQFGAEISVIRIPQKDSSEMYVRFSLPQTIQGTYRVRFSQKIEFGKDYLQLFEYSCGKNKFLVIFKASRHRYYGNREIYDEIINSFTMEC